MSIRAAEHGVRLASADCTKIVPKVAGYEPLKRLFDIAVSGVLLILFSPILLAVAIAVKLTSRGPMLYVSDRVGLCGRVFKFYKFRSMSTDADARRGGLMGNNEKDGPIFKMRRDPRITPIGKFLRKYSLDELPQLWNVFKGDMSIVGPRPPIPAEVEQYGPYELQRLSIRPGLTCYWQVMGRSDLTFEEWMELDHRYIREMSPMVDLRIMLMTPKAVIGGKGAY